MNIKKATVRNFSVFHVGTLSYEVRDNRTGEVLSTHRSLSRAYSAATLYADDDKGA